MSNVTLKQIDEAIILAHRDSKMAARDELMGVRDYLLGKPVDKPRDPREVMVEVGYKVS
tara:strand:+ start:37 stop:213 length:177 start_codon:yes stop_codon:yes gene_type:complete